MQIDAVTHLEVRPRLFAGGGGGVGFSLASFSLFRRRVDPDFFASGGLDFTQLSLPVPSEEALGNKVHPM